MSHIPKKIREEVYHKYGGQCAYCGCDLPNRWHVDHIEPILRGVSWHKGDNSIENLNPACPSCNISKGGLKLEAWREWIQNHVTSLNRDVNIYKIAKRYGLVTETGARVKFYFERGEDYE